MNVNINALGSLSDAEVLKELGERVARHRLNRNETQAAVAREAGVARRTVSKLETGRVIDIQSLIRILRALDLLGGLDQLIPAPPVSPVALAEARGRVRERARGKRGTAPADQPESAEWKWPDQER